MTAKQWLSRGMSIDREINTLLTIRDGVKARATSVTQTISGDPVQGTKDPHKFDRLVELDEQIDRLVDRLVETRMDIISAIGELEDGRLRELLYKRYIEGKRFEQIAVEMRYSWRQTCRLHGDALVKMEGVLHAENLLV